jgi:4-hydroxy-tetrahydrodipicolinate synthase
LTTLYITPPPENIVAHYRAVSDAVKIPIMLYNIPRNTVNALSPEIVAELADIETVVAIKESSGDFNNLYKTFNLAGDKIRVFLGPVAKFGVPAYTLGCSGGIEIIANFWPDGPITLYDAVKSGNLEEAYATQRRMHDLLELVIGNGRNMYAAEKAILNILGLKGGYPRPPLLPLEEPHLSELREGLAKAGLPSGGRVQSAAE